MILLNPITTRSSATTEGPHIAWLSYVWNLATPVASTVPEIWLAPKFNWFT